MEQRILNEFKHCSYCKQACRCEYCDGCRIAKGLNALSTAEKIERRPELKKTYEQ